MSIHLTRHSLWPFGSVWSSVVVRRVRSHNLSCTYRYQISTVTVVNDQRYVVGVLDNLGFKRLKMSVFFQTTLKLLNLHRAFCKLDELDNRSKAFGLENYRTLQTSLKV